MNGLPSFCYYYEKKIHFAKISGNNFIFVRSYKIGG